MLFCWTMNTRCRLITTSLLIELVLIANTLLYHCNGLKPNEIDENLLHTRCKLKCFRNLNDKNCVANCMEDTETMKKPGTCPISAQSIYDLTCIDYCQSDYECSETKKCCSQACGWICQDPNDLENDTATPSRPFNISVAEQKRKGREINVSWYSGVDYPNFYVLESRSHVGKVLAPYKLGQWQWMHFQKIAETKIYETVTLMWTVVNVKLQKGHWYQFRVASINEYGFKGYSAPSQPFRLTEQSSNNIAAPKHVKAPKNFIVDHIFLLRNGSVYAKATWNAPRSDLPVEKYIITWALYLKSVNGSLLLHEDSVKEPQRHYNFSDLLPNSMYYFQIQAICIFGKRRLKSQKESFMVNTTITTSAAEDIFHSDDSHHHHHHHHTSDLWINKTECEIQNNDSTSVSRKEKPNLEFKFIASKRYGMLVRVLWSDIDHENLIELCSDRTDCETKEYAATRLKRNHTDFLRLKFNTEYTVRIKDPHHPTSSEDNEIASETFRTPTCENFLRRRPTLGIVC